MVSSASIVFLVHFKSLNTMNMWKKIHGAINDIEIYTCLNGHLNNLGISIYKYAFLYRQLWVYLVKQISTCLANSLKNNSRMSVIEFEKRRFCCIAKKVKINYNEWHICSDWLL